MAKVKAPNASFNGIVAGVHFADGQAETTDPSALGYFRRQGYVIDGTDLAASTEEPVDPRDIGDGTGHETVGTKLRDASVDPRPEDFLPPTNAGQANPHGPEVVAPGIHGVEGVRPVRPGEVAVEDPDVQEVAETAHTEAVIDDTDPTRPAGNASREEWEAFATSVGVEVEEGMSRNDIRDAVKAHEAPEA
jgi:hypothetical protein